jgi:hypothetical protein
MAMGQSSSDFLPAAPLRSPSPLGVARGLGLLRCLGEEALELGENGSVPVRLEVDLVAASVAAHKTGSGQLLQLALDSSHGAAGVPHQFAEVVLFVGVTQQPSKHASPRAAKKERRWVENCSHVFPRGGQTYPKRER